MEGMNIDKRKDLLLSSSRYAEQKRYWLEKLPGEIAPVSIVPGGMFTGKTRSPDPGSKEREIEKIPIDIPGPLSGRLLSLAKHSDLSLYMILLTALKCLIYRYTGDEDIVVISPLHKNNLTRETINDRVFLYDRVKGEMTFKDLLFSVRETSLQAYKNQDYPFDVLLEQLQGISPHRRRAPATDTGIVCTLRNIHTERNIRRLRDVLTVAFTRKDEDVKGEILYTPNLFETFYIRRMSRHLAAVMEACLEDVNIKLSGIDLLSTQEKKQLLEDFNGPREEILPGQTVLQLIESRGEQTPDRVAVSCDHLQVTFGQLDKRALRLAAYLRGKGLARDNVVGILMNRSLEMIESILAVWKAGGAYLPIDPDYPQERIDYMLADSNAAVVLNFEHLNFEFVSNFEFRASNLSSSELAYVIYTSGSTGKPKGVIIEHPGMLNHIRAKIDDLGISHRSITAQNASHTFDISVWQFFAALTVGGKSIIYTNDLILEPERFISRVVRDGITLLEVVPSYLSIMLDYIEEKGREPLPMDYLMVTGEEIKPSLVARWFKHYPGIRMVNAYGPTEASDDITHHIMDNLPESDRVPIGQPLRNFSIYIVDHHMNLCPVGVKGEIWVSGTGVGRGYLNNPELTAEKFKRAVIGEKKGTGRKKIPAAKIYKTGDLGRWLPDGTIDFFGRKDYQLKIRGFRIELGEIENRLLAHPGVKEAAVIDKKDDTGNPYLCAYVVSHASGVTGLKEYLSGYLPGYMVPSYIVEMERMPLTANGKIDRKALPEPGAEARGKLPYAPPRNRIEAICVEVWAEVLGMETSRVGIDDNFFDSGGHSLKAVTLLSKLHKELDVKIPLITIFNSPSIRRLSQYIESAAQTPYLTIRPAPLKEYYTLSSAQKRLYIVQQMDPHSTVYNITQVYLLENPDAGRFEKTFKKLIRRHESLRTSFHIINDEPVQRIHDDVEFEIGYYDAMAQESTAEDRPQKAGHPLSEFIRPFELSRSPLIRVGLIKQEKGIHLLAVDMHHIISDGISHDILAQDFAALYEGGELSPLRLQYKDYAEWQNSPTQRQLLEQQEIHWLKDLEGEIPVLNLTADYPRPVIQSFEGRVLSFAIGKEETKALKKLAPEKSVTLYFLLLAVYYVFLFKVTNQEDIVVGTPVAGRSHTDLGKIIGMFVNMLVLRNYPREDKQFNEFLEEVRDRGITAFENQDYPFEDLVMKLVLKKDPGRNPLFDTAFGFETLEMENTRGIEAEDDISAVKPRPYKHEHRNSRFDISLYGIDYGETLGFTFEYCTKLFKEGTVRGFIDYFKKTLLAILENPGVKLWEIRLIWEEEKKSLLDDFNDTFIHYPYNKPLHRLLEEWSEKKPEGIAAAGTETGLRNISITYRSLNTKSGQLARLLREKGIRADNVVGITAKRSIGTIIGILGILKAGGAYLPIDPDYPQERIDFMVKDSNAAVVLEAENLNFNVASEGGFCASNVMSSNLAYIIYTSGSTGKPKGVMVEHRNVARLVKNQNFIEFKPSDKLLLTGAPVFDITTFEIWAPLLNGFPLFVVPQNHLFDAETLGNFLAAYKISILHLVPQLFDRMAGEHPGIFETLRYLLVGGDMVRPMYVNTVRKRCKHLRILHMYGPTENTTFSTFFPVDDRYEVSIPIGKPIGNSTVYILDRHNRLIPPGIVGELCVGGAGVSRGYLNNPELTAEKFKKAVINSSLKTDDRFYKTGDLARLLPGGDIEFLGRRDHQVKIRGIRIELGEIESRLLTHEEVKEAVVVAADNKGDKYLAAYWVPVSAHPGSTSSYDPKFREFLSKDLPEHMIPSYFIEIEKIPVTSNGKIDRKALPEPQRGKTAENYAAPRDNVEESLTGIWSDLLKIEKETISIDDNFYQLGGHSLNATIMVSRIHRQFDVKIPLAVVFTAPSIRELAQFIKNAVINRFIALEPQEKKDYYDVSPAQKRVYLTHHMEAGNIGYNIPQVKLLDRALEIDKNKLEKITVPLIKRHESLRTSFLVVEGKPVQKINRDVTLNIEYYTANSAHQVKRIIRDFVRPFDLSNAPLLRVGILDNLLLLDLHHIISDEFSQEILVKDFLTLVEEKELSPLRLQYKDYSQWQNTLLETGKMKQQEEYWRNRFKEDIPPLNLPTDYPRPEVQRFEGSTLNFRIDEQETAALNNLALQEGVTSYMVLHALFHILLSKISGREDIVIGTPVAGRRHADLQQIIGMLVNTLPLRNRYTGDERFLDFLKAVKKNAVDALENQDYPFEELVEQVVMTRDRARNPLFDVMFIYHEINRSPRETGTPGTTGKIDESVKPERSPQDQIHSGMENRTSKFDMTWRATAVKNKLYFRVEYSTKLFKNQTIEKFITYFKQILSSILENPEQHISEVEIGSESERKEKLSLLYQDLEIEIDEELP